MTKNFSKFRIWHQKDASLAKILNLIKFMVLSVLMFLPISAYTQFSGGDGTEGNPYIITTPAQLAQLATYVNEANIEYNAKHYKLGNNLDLSDYQTGAGWIPIGNDPNSFRGVFNGDNHIITGLYINNTSRAHVGLFGRLIGTNTATTKANVFNLGIKDAEIISNFNGIAYAGGIVGQHAGDGGLDKCFFTGSISVAA